MNSVPMLKEAGSFASLLASLTGSTRRTSEIWDDSALSDDVATISYEQALRSQRRTPSAEKLTVNEAAGEQQYKHVDAAAIVTGKIRKTASITIRLTKEEEVQLHERAAAAQLSVSAYLRSCIFEAESLRQQVKEALSQIKLAALPEKKACANLSAKQALSWRARFLPRWSRDGASA